MEDLPKENNQIVSLLLAHSQVLDQTNPACDAMASQIYTNGRTPKLECNRHCGGSCAFIHIYIYNLYEQEPESSEQFSLQVLYKEI